MNAYENDNNEADFQENSSHSSYVRQMNKNVNVQRYKHIRPLQKRHHQQQRQRQQLRKDDGEETEQQHKPKMPDDEREYFIELNSDALQMEYGSDAIKDESVRKARRSNEEEINPMNTSMVYNDNTIGNELCMDTNSSMCHHNDIDNETCIGDPAYCNYTYEEYVQMLHDYITPTLPEWILIGSHAIVFFIGLVSITHTHTHVPTHK